MEQNYVIVTLCIGYIIFPFNSWLSFLRLCHLLHMLNGTAWRHEMFPICRAVDMQPLQSEADAQQSDLNGRETADFEGNNQTEDARDQSPGVIRNTLQHSSNTADTAEDHTLRDSDAYSMVNWPTDWTDVEVKKLGRQKPQDQSSTNEVHSYHIDLSAYYASSQTVSTANLFIIASSALFPICCITAH